MKKLLPILIAIFIGGIFFFYQMKGDRSVKELVISTVAAPTPFPFQEYTIPYLRERNYESTIGELSEISSNGNYTTYLASYTSDGLKINGLITIPTGEIPENGFPAIVFVHGYIPPTLYQTQSSYVAHVDYLARNGFIVFKIDLRGHGESEGEASGAYYSSDYIIDTLNAYSALENMEDVNPKAIGLWGHSMAGNVVMRSLASKPEVPAAVIWGGAVYSYEDRKKYGIQDGSYRPPVNASLRQKKREELFKAHGEFSATSPYWRMVAPTNYLTDLRGAIQLNHATDDDVVSIGYSRDLKVLLDKAGVTNELHEYSSGGHNITGSSFNAAMDNTVEFFRKYLK